MAEIVAVDVRRTMMHGIPWNGLAVILYGAFGYERRPYCARVYRTP